MSPSTPLDDHHRREADGLSSGAGPSDAGAVHRPGAAVGTVGPLEVEYLPWGPPRDDGGSCEILATIGSVEVEYAALRRGCGLIDGPNRGTVELEGADRLDLLDRLITQRVVDLGVGGVARGFLLERTGRIIADLLIVETGKSILVDVDVHNVAMVTNMVHAMIFSEDAIVQPDDGRWYRFGIHGPACSDLLGALSMVFPGPGQAVHGVLAGETVWIARDDSLGEPGVMVFLPTASVGAAWSALHEAGAGLEVPVRTAGWYATNMARLEARMPHWNIDFGPTNLPHETGLLARRVSFTKGCYPGQEVVARMEHLGHPKQVLRCLMLPDERLPVAGAQVYAREEDIPGTPVGVVTSSAPSPMNGSNAMALAMLRWSAAQPGGSVTVIADGAGVQARVEDAG